MAYETAADGPSASEILAGNERALWIVAIAFFGVGDLVTTVVGLRLQQIAEVGPYVDVVIQAHGVPAMVGLKLLVFVLCWSLWRLVPPPHRVGVPLGLAVLGVLVTLWNTGVLATVVVTW